VALGFAGVYLWMAARGSLRGGHGSGLRAAHVTLPPDRR